MQTIEGTYRWSGGMILTHMCPRNCRFCCDKLIHTSNRVCTIEEVERLLIMCDHEEEEVKDVFILGGEPLCAEMEHLREICNRIHAHNYKSVLTSAQINPEKLLQLDGYVDFLNLSYYKDSISEKDFGKMNFTKDFKYTDVVWSKLLLKSAFPTFETFESFLDTAIQGGFQFKFSTLNPDSPNLQKDHPEWVDSWAEPLKVPIFHGKAEGLMYKGSLVKLLHNAKEVPAYLRLHPNGVINRDWDDEETNLF